MIPPQILPEANHSRILVADDDPACLNALAGLVRSFGFTPVRASDGDDAIRLLRSEEIDAAIIDLQMPKANGIQVIRLISSLKAENRPPVVLISGAATRASHRIAGEAGAEALIEKPVNHAVLRELLDSVLSSGCARSPASALLVEDHLPTRSAVAGALRRAGFAPDEAGSLQEARALLDNDYSLVVLDLNLPDGTAETLIDSIRRTKRGVPIIGVTGEAAGDLVRRSMASGADCVLSKPVSVPEIVTLAKTYGTMRREKRRVEVAHLEGAKGRRREALRREIKYGLMAIAVAAVLSIFIFLVSDRLMQTLNAADRSDEPSITEMYAEIQGYLERDEDRETGRRR